MSDSDRQIKDSLIFERRAPIGASFSFILNAVGKPTWNLIIRSVRNHSNAEIDYLEMHLTNDKFFFSIKQWQCLLCLVNEDPSKNVQKLDMNYGEEEEVRYEKFMRLDEILAENSGFVIDGKLRVRVEIRMLVLCDPTTGLSMFNFCDPFENCVTINMLDVTFYGNKQVMMTHCGALRSEIMAGNTKICISTDDDWLSVYYVLSWIHGVRSDRCYLEPYYYVSERCMFKLAKDWGILGFPRYRIVKLVDFPSECDIYAIGLMVGNVLERRLNALFSQKHRLKTIHNVEELQEQTINWQLEKLNCDCISLNEETVKAIVQRFFYLENDCGLSQLEHVSNPWDLQKRMEKWKLEDLELEMMQAVAQKFFSFENILTERYKSMNVVESLEELQELIGRWETGKLDRYMMSKGENHVESLL